jgi:putative Mg2+ transporter-C (MgtC) family protein
MTLVTGASALFTMVSGALVLGSGEKQDADPIRAVQAIAIGIGFLGAGAVRVSPQGIVGLTTAATIWAAAAIGITVATGRLGVALGATALFLAVLRLLVKLERRAQ